MPCLQIIEADLAMLAMGFLGPEATLADSLGEQASYACCLLLPGLLAKVGATALPRLGVLCGTAPHLSPACLAPASCPTPL
jgi:hypothetical protein